MTHDSSNSNNPPGTSGTQDEVSSKTLWAGRYETEPVAALRKLNDSLPFDKRLYAQDIKGSRAWAQALAQAGVITQAEADQIRSGLDHIGAEFEAGTFSYASGDEDIHTAVERRLTELIGPVAGKLHTGRSRNDQVVTDLRLWLADQQASLGLVIEKLLKAIVQQAEQHVETVMPGYTHMRAAQPISAAYWLMSFAEMLFRDTQRLGAADPSPLFSSPLGSAALAGSAYPIDRELLAHSLGFSQQAVTYNGLDAVSDRDFAAEFLFTSAMLMLHLSRLAEDVILYSSPQFGFVSLDERYTTGSSIMPQKQNPDVLELTRGKTGRIIGHLTGFLTTLKGLPSGYNKDLQEDKEPLFDTVDTLQTLLPALTGLIETMHFNPDTMRAALDEGMLATDLADYLVGKGVPFREAHAIVGKAVRRSLDTNTPFSKLSLADYQGLSRIFTPDVFDLFDFSASIARRSVLGGTAPDAVRAQIAAMKAELER